MDIILTATSFYLLGVIFVMGITESVDEDNPQAGLRLALTWPFVALLMMMELIVEQLNGKQ